MISGPESPRSGLRCQGKESPHLPPGPHTDSVRSVPGSGRVTKGRQGPTEEVRPCPAPAPYGITVRVNDEVRVLFTKTQSKSRDRPLPGTGSLSGLPPSVSDSHPWTPDSREPSSSRPEGYSTEGVSGALRVCHRAPVHRPSHVPSSTNPPDPEGVEGRSLVGSGDWVNPGPGRSPTPVRSTKTSLPIPTSEETPVVGETGPFTGHPSTRTRPS